MPVLKRTLVTACWWSLPVSIVVGTSSRFPSPRAVMGGESPQSSAMSTGLGSQASRPSSADGVTEGSVRRSSQEGLQGIPPNVNVQMRPPLLASPDSVLPRPGQGIPPPPIRYPGELNRPPMFGQPPPVISSPGAGGSRKGRSPRASRHGSGRSPAMRRCRPRSRKS